MNSFDLNDLIDESITDVLTQIDEYIRSDESGRILKIETDDRLTRSMYAEFCIQISKTLSKKGFHHVNIGGRFESKFEDLLQFNRDFIIWDRPMDRSIYIRINK